MEEKVILITDNDSATYQTNIKGWVSSKGYFFGEDEKSARYNGCTHIKCGCGNIFPKSSYCEQCYKKKSEDRYNSYKKVEWDGESPICLFDSDVFFMNGMEEVIDYCYENDVILKDLKFCHLKPAGLPTIDIDDFFADICSNLEYDVDIIDMIPQNIIDKIDDLNRALENAEPILWEEDQKAVIFKKE